MKNVYIVSGASGSGKTSIIPDLKKQLGNSFSLYDFDDIGVPKTPDKKWRQKSTELWLQKILQQGNEACLLGQVVLGEILSCPSAKYMDRVKFCLLDVFDYERILRLKQRNTHGVDQHMLNWAAWLRMHLFDPQWMQQVIKDECWDGLDFTRWDQLDNWNNFADVRLLDTTNVPIINVAENVAQWILKTN